MRNSRRGFGIGNISSGCGSSSSTNSGSNTNSSDSTNSSGGGCSISSIMLQCDARVVLCRVVHIRGSVY